MIKDGFVLNPYDACVANKEINGSQCTIIWHVDDLKISHKDPKVVDSVLAWLEKLFRKITTRRGKKYTYLGMDLDITEFWIRKSMHVILPKRVYCRFSRQRLQQRY